MLTLSLWRTTYRVHVNFGKNKKKVLERHLIIDLMPPLSTILNEALVPILFLQKKKKQTKK